MKGTVILKPFGIFWGGEVSDLSGIMYDISMNKKNLGLGNLRVELGGRKGMHWLGRTV